MSAYICTVEIGYNDIKDANNKWLLCAKFRVTTYNTNLTYIR